MRSTLGMLLVSAAIAALIGAFAGGGREGSARAQVPVSPTPTQTPSGPLNAPQATSQSAQGATSPPTFLSLLVAPRVLPGGGGQHEALFVQLLDAGGRAATSPLPVDVRLAANDPRFATVPSNVTIPAGVSAIVVSITASGEGSTTLTAQANGLTSAQATLTTQTVAVAAAGTALGLEFAPAAFLLGARGPTWLTVSVLDSGDGKPVTVSEDTEVRLVSSQPDVVQVPASVTIPAGAFSATVDVGAQAEGFAVVTALRSGFASTTKDISVFPAAPAGEPRLVVIAVPGKRVSGSTTAPRFVLQTVAGDNIVLPFPCAEIELSSSRPGVITVPDRVTPECEPGWHAVVVEGVAGNDVGVTAITAALPGVGSGNVSVETTGAAVARISATLAPSAPIYGAPSAGWVVVEAFDAGGRPAPLAADLTLSLSAPPGLAPGTATIKRGDSSTLVPLGRVEAAETPTLRVTTGTLDAAELTIQPSRASLPAATGPAGGTPSAAFEFGRWRVPVLWLFIPGALALVGLVVVIVWTSRAGRGEPGGR